MEATGEADSTAKAVIAAVYATTGNLRTACKQAGVTYPTMLLWRREDPRFEAALESAKHEAAEQVIGTLFDRFVNGWQETFIDKHGTEHHTRKFLSERAAQILLSAWRPAEFSNRMQAEVLVRDESVEQVVLERLSDPAMFAAIEAATDQALDD